MADGTVSVVVPVKDGERHLADALTSVSAQTHPPGEVVVVDASAGDGCRAIVDAFGGVVYRRQGGDGIAAGFNEGIEATTGSLVAFLAHDDRWHPEKLERQVAWLADRPATDVALTGMRYFVDGAAPPGFRPELLDGPVDGWVLEAAMVRRTVFDTVGRFDPAFASALDVDWFARLRNASVVIDVVPDVLLDKRVHAASTSLTAEDNDALLLAALRRKVRSRRPAP